jgi:ribosomal protein S18 acetylase RimI-like enzyme
MTEQPVESGELSVSGEDPDLEARLYKALYAHNVDATDVDDQRTFTIKVCDDTGDLVAGLSGWTWGTCAGIARLWVRPDRRHQRWGSRLLSAAEGEARGRGCVQMVVSSLTFQAPAFYTRHGYLETGRTEGLPAEGYADVQFRKTLGPTAQPPA